MSHGNDIASQKKIFKIVFLALMIGTALTVYVAGLHFSVAMGVIVALIIASIKGTLVAGYFMHLFHEKKIIFFILLMTLVFFLVLIFIPLSTQLDSTSR